MIRIDPHVHTHYSEYGGWNYDAVGSPEQVLERARDVGLDCIAITDHDAVEGAIAAQKIARDMESIDVIPGIEVSSRDGHILALDVSTSIPKGLSASETVQLIHDRGGLAVAAHPTRSSGVSLDADAGFDAVEAWNARTSSRQNERAASLALERGLPLLAASDAHHWKDVGRAHTIVDEAPLPSGLLTGSHELVREGMTKWMYLRLYAAKLRYNLRHFR